MVSEEKQKTYGNKVEGFHDTILTAADEQQNRNLYVVSSKSGHDNRKIQNVIIKKSELK